MAIFNRPATASNPSLAPPKRALGFLLYEGGFVAVAGEWIGMWQSASHAAGPSAFQILITMMGFLIFVALKDVGHGVEPKATGRPGYAPADLLNLYTYGYLG